MAPTVLAQTRNAPRHTQGLDRPGGGRAAQIINVPAELAEKGGYFGLGAGTSAPARSREGLMTRTAARKPLSAHAAGVEQP